MTPLEILTQAKALIADQKNWGQHEYAQDAAGNQVGLLSERACKWCAMGAKGRVQRLATPQTEDTSERLAWANACVEATRFMIQAAGDYSIPNLNDGMKPIGDRLPTPDEAHGQVMEMYSAAIELAGAAE